MSTLLDELNDAWEANEDLSRRLEERDRQLTDAYAEIDTLSQGDQDARRRKGA